MLLRMGGGMGVLLRRLSTGEFNIWEGLSFRRRGFLTGCDRFATNEALDEIYRVLKEGAVFGMIWNIDDCEIALHPELLTSKPPLPVPWH